MYSIFNSFKKRSVFEALVYILYTGPKYYASPPPFYDQQTFDPNAHVMHTVLLRIFADIS
jgi:hypothetical protein